MTDESGNEVEVDIRLSQGNTVITVVPRAPLKLGETYTVSFSGVSDASRQPGPSAPDFRVVTFEPRRLGAPLQSGHTWPVTQLARWQKTDGDGRKRTFALGTKRSSGFPDPHVAVFDFLPIPTSRSISDPSNGDPSVPANRAIVLLVSKTCLSRR